MSLNQRVSALVESQGELNCPWCFGGLEVVLGVHRVRPVPEGRCDLHDSREMARRCSTEGPEIKKRLLGLCNISRALC